MTNKGHCFNAINSFVFLCKNFKMLSNINYKAKFDDKKLLSKLKFSDYKPRQHVFKGEDYTVIIFQIGIYLGSLEFILS